MAVAITPPGANDDVRKLWRTVAQCVDVLNAISNMKVVVEGRVHMLGQLEVSGNSSTLTIQEGKEVAN